MREWLDWAWLRMKLGFSCASYENMGNNARVSEVVQVVQTYPSTLLGSSIRLVFESFYVGMIAYDTVHASPIHDNST